MAAKPRSFSQSKLVSSLMVNGTLILICLIWLVPTIGVLITSFRNSQDIFKSGWWTVFPHREDVQSGEIKVDPSVDVNGPITVEGITTTFEEWRNGVTLPDGRKLTWYGNKRTRTLIVSEQKWVGFATNLTLDNYTNTSVRDKKSASRMLWADDRPQGQQPGRRLPELGGGRRPGHHHPDPDRRLCRLWLCLAEFPRAEDCCSSWWSLCWSCRCRSPWCQSCRDYTRLDLNGTYLAIWLAHTGFGLPLAIYLLFNYISTLPREMLESAFIDGASNFTIFTQLILPLVGPGAGLLCHLPVPVGLE